ncbi:MAG: nucleoside transporter C-terminal domain-containing protein [Clostridia bacterium]|uniref:NupC/NupG family nucleoside CNT transporter n=1 Tax=Clostridium sp. TaxID=1506 RepID=UPI002FCB1511
MNRIITILGVLILLSVLYFASTDKDKVDKKMIGKALLMQIIFALIIVKLPIGQFIMDKISAFVTTVINFGYEGLTFVFGGLADSGAPTGMIFAIQTLGVIVFVSALAAALNYMGVIGWIVEKLGGVIEKIFGISKAESFVVCANMFLGQTDAPILVKDVIKNMNNSEILLMLISGMGSISATILIGYAGLGIPMKFLLIACALVPLSSIMVSKLLMPQTEKVKEQRINMDLRGDSTNILSAITDGALNGMNMAFAIGASLIAIIGLVAMLNGFFGLFGTSLQGILSVVFAPLAFIMGVPFHSVLDVSSLLGTKMALNEFVAYSQLGGMLSTLDPRTAMMVSVALCGFANVSSIGICIGGISILAPSKKDVISKLAVRGMIGGFLVSVLSAMIVGIVM